MVTDSKRFTDEMMQLVAKKHSKDHPIFPMIARGELSDDALKGFVKQFYLLFPKPFPHVFTKIQIVSHPCTANGTIF